MWVLIYTLMIADGSAVTKFKYPFKSLTACVEYAEKEIVSPYHSNSKFECKLDKTGYWTK